jgi:hypothetical protein
MGNVKKIPWINLTLQVFYLPTSVLFHMFVAPELRRVLYEMNIKPTIVMYILIETPLLIVGAVCAFFLFLLAWKYDYLENRLVVTLINFSLFGWAILIYELQAIGNVILSPIIP